jgi:hypothetical protein
MPTPTTPTTPTTQPILPAEFADLEPYAGWALPTADERYDKRLASTMDELQAFYDAVYPRLDDGLTHLDAYGLDDLPDDAKRLLWLFAGLVTASFPVEVWRQPRVPDSGASSFDCIAQPSV